MNYALLKDRDTRFAVSIIHPKTGQEVSAEALYNSCCAAFGYQIKDYIGDLILDNMDYMKPPEDEDQIALMSAVYAWADKVQAWIEAGYPCNLFAHRMLTDEGCYVHTHYAESYEDIGNGESGPKLSGGPAYDEYAGDSHILYFDDDGDLQWMEARDIRREEFEDFMCAVMDQ